MLLSEFRVSAVSCVQCPRFSWHSQVTVSTVHTPQFVVPATATWYTVLVWYHEKQYRIQYINYTQSTARRINDKTTRGPRQVGRLAAAGGPNLAAGCRQGAARLPAGAAFAGQPVSREIDSVAGFQAPAGALASPAGTLPPLATVVPFGSIKT